MDIETAKSFLKENVSYLEPVILSAQIADRYYKVHNDILMKESKDEDESVLRNADNRVCNSFYPLLVNQKSAYMFTSPPLFDIGSDNDNKTLTKILGDKYVKNCKKLCVSASNCGSAWVHYWINADKEFRWGVIDGTQIVPIKNNDLDEEIYAVVRTYQKVDEEDGQTYIVYEIWNDKECEAFRRKINEDYNRLSYYNVFDMVNSLTGVHSETNRYTHSFGRVPFIPFYNNSLCSTDLENIKGLIDTYDKTYNGFANDLEDIQEVIMVLTGYSGTDKKELLDDIKHYKVIKLDDPESGSVNTLNIEIPVEARKTMLDMTRKAIFTQGQGVDPEQENFGNASGVALKFLYSLLELKAGLMQTEFMLGFNELVRAICDYCHLSIKDDNIIQTWTRTSISNDTETASICKDSVGVISNETIVKNHPFVENPADELEKIKTEKEDSETEYMNAFKKTSTVDGDDGE